MRAPAKDGREVAKEPGADLANAHRPSSGAGPRNADRLLRCSASVIGHTTRPALRALEFTVMIRSMRPVLLTLSLLAIAGSAAAQGHNAHSHGVARLEVTIDGPAITLRLESPLESLLGFERAPRNDAERGQVHAMAQALRAGNAFVPTAAARRRVERVELKSPVLAPELLGASSGAAAGKAADDHADLEGTFVYRCEDARALAGIDVMLFDSFKRLRRVDAQVAGPKGQSAAKLTARSRQLRW